MRGNKTLSYLTPRVYIPRDLTAQLFGDTFTIYPVAAIVLQQQEKQQTFDSALKCLLRLLSPPREWLNSILALLLISVSDYCVPTQAPV